MKRVLTEEQKARRQAKIEQGARGPSLRPASAAFLFNVSEKTFWSWVATRHDMPKPRRPTKRCTLFDRAELLAWRDQQMSK